MPPRYMTRATSACTPSSRRATWSKGSAKRTWSSSTNTGRHVRPTCRWRPNLVWRCRKPTARCRCMRVLSMRSGTSCSLPVSLGMNPRMIRVYSNPVGGGFGSKDELTIQGGIALLAMKTGKPVKVFLSREESLVSGWKRHPFIVRIRTGFKNDGTMLANDVTCYEDKGAYSSLGGPILNLALEHASSLYRVPNTRHEGWAVFTNNGVCGAFRGFGVPQVLFCLLYTSDAADDLLCVDPVTIRRKNVLHQGEVSPIGHTLRTGVSMDLVLDAVEKSDLWQHREEYKKADKPWLRRGVALAL